MMISLEWLRIEKSLNITNVNNKNKETKRKVIRKDKKVKLINCIISNNNVIML